MWHNVPQMNLKAYDGTVCLLSLNPQIRQFRRVNVVQRVYNAVMRLIASVAVIHYNLRERIFTTFFQSNDSIVGLLLAVVGVVLQGAESLVYVHFFDFSTAYLTYSIASVE